GALAAWTGFTLPSAIVLMLFAIGISSYGDIVPLGVLHGLKVAAVAVVAQAVWGMGKNLCTDVARISIMALAACFVLLVPSALAQVSVIAIAAIIGLLWFKPDKVMAHDPLPITIRRPAALFWLFLFFSLLIGLPLLTALYPSQTLSMVDTFFRAGSLVFGGGHVVLPLLQAEIVPAGWISNDTFLAGYG
ncbi:chromate transporter, partial [Psychrobacter sp. 16-Bac2893]